MGLHRKGTTLAICLAILASVVYLTFNHQGLLSSADRLAQSGDFGRAITQLGRIPAHSPQYDEAKRARRRIAHQWAEQLAGKGEYRNAADVLMQHGELTEHDLRPYRVRWGNTLLARGAHREAMEQFKKGRVLQGPFFQAYLAATSSKLAANTKSLARQHGKLVATHQQDGLTLLDSLSDNNPEPTTFGDFRFQTPLLWLPGLVLADKEEHFTFFGQEGIGQLSLTQLYREPGTSPQALRGWISQVPGWESVAPPRRLQGLLFRQMVFELPHLAHYLYVLPGRETWGIAHLVIPLQSRQLVGPVLERFQGL